MSEEAYFKSYAHANIHEEMIKDKSRTYAYFNAIVHNKHLFKDKVVLDIGCGTGILSLFAAKAGAKIVYAVDNSDIADYADRIVLNNNYKHVITVIKDKVENLAIEPNSVDVIVSEWMGYFLVYESMLDSVIFARDKFLKKETGIIMPNVANMYICGIEDGYYKHEKISFWDSVYGFDMSAMSELALFEPIVDSIKQESVVTDTQLIKSIDLEKVQLSELKCFSSDFTLTCRANQYVHSLVVFFDTQFTHCHVPIVLSTGPEDEYTHWKQTILYLKDEILCDENDEIHGLVQIAQNKDHKRYIDIDLKVEFANKKCNLFEQNQYRMC